MDILHLIGIIWVILGFVADMLLLHYAEIKRNYFRAFHNHLLIWLNGLVALILVVIILYDDKKTEI